MSKKCCKSNPPCKDCPKRKKKKAISTVDRETVSYTHLTLPTRSSVDLGGRRIIKKKKTSKTLVMTKHHTKTHKELIRSINKNKTLAQK